MGENAVLRVVDSYGVCVLEVLDRENIQFIFRSLIQLKERRQIHGQAEAGGEIPRRHHVMQVGVAGGVDAVHGNPQL